MEFDEAGSSPVLWNESEYPQLISYILGSIGVAVAPEDVKKKKVQETLNILTWQQDTVSQTKQIDAEKKAREQAMLKEQWAKETDADKEAERQKFILNRERNIELINHNAAERELRAIQTEAEK